MKYIRAFFAFWYDFIVGDAWEVAVGVALGLIAFYLIAHYATTRGTLGGAPVLILPILIIALLGYSLWRVRKTR